MRALLSIWSHALDNKRDGSSTSLGSPHRVRGGLQKGGKSPDTSAAKSTSSHEDIGVEHPTIILGEWAMRPWCAPAYSAAHFLPGGPIYVCEFCLQPIKDLDTLARHMSRPHSAHPPHPPGREIYRSGDLAIWEVDGAVQPLYGQHLCLLAKAFLDHKTVHAHVAPFVFYVLTRWGPTGAQLLGYFSKDKRQQADAETHCSLSCILTLPPFQRQGCGHLLIDFSYHLLRMAGLTGSPETPLSDLGLASYRRYWAGVLSRHVAGRAAGAALGLRGVAEATGIEVADLVSTLQVYHAVKHWRTQYVVLPAHLPPPRPPLVAFDPAALDASWRPLSMVV